MILICTFLLVSSRSSYLVSLPFLTLSLLIDLCNSLCPCAASVIKWLSESTLLVLPAIKIDGGPRFLGLPGSSEGDVRTYKSG